MRLSGLALCTVQDELRKLSAIGLVTSWSNGYHRYYQASERHALFADLVRIVQTSERLPTAKHAVLYRKHYSRAQSKRRQRTKPLPPDRLVKWNLFSHKTRQKT